MGKHSKKRQRTTNDADTSNLQPLGSMTSLVDDKNEEEKRLEHLLFGTTFTSSQTGPLLHTNETNQANLDVNGDVNGELGNVMDSDVRSYLQFLVI
jgi:hypothetical protein